VRDYVEFFAFYIYATAAWDVRIVLPRPPCSAQATSRYTASRVTWPRLAPTFGIEDLYIVTLPSSEVHRRTISAVLGGIALGPQEDQALVVYLDVIDRWRL